MSLYDSYNTLLLKSSMTFEDVFLHDKDIRKFIKNKYHAREKSKAFEVATKEFDLFKRGRHEVSAYFLGCVLSNIVWYSLEEFIKSFTKVVDEGYKFDFEYIWSLIAIYHDIVIDKEEKLRDDYETIQLSNTEDVVECIKKHYLSIDKDIYKDNSTVIPLYHTYQDDLVVNYMKMRIESDRKFDHGIVAGFLLYNALVNNYYVQKANAKYYDETYFETESRVNNRKLYWHKLDLWIYGFIADAIIAHNIWFCDLHKEEEKTKYKKFKLDYLIVNNGMDNRLSVKNNPLAFYLGLIDTIEPIKSFSNKDNIDTVEICKRIDLCSNGKNISIKRTGELNNFERYRSKIKEMERWLKVEVKNDGDDICIKIL